MRRPRGRTVALRGLHLLVLSSFGVAQPLFDILGDTPEFFVVRGSTTWDIVAFGLGAVLLPPALLLALEVLPGLAHRRAGDLLHTVFVALLLALVAMQALKRLESLPADAVVAGAILLGAGGALAYARRAGLRSVLTILGPAPLLFLALFLIDSPLDKLSLASDAQAGAPPAISSRAPVVLLVFDELPVASLMDGEQQVDRRRLPNFGALADDSTFFRNATTVHEHTTEAVPAILTGRDPKPGAVPLLSDHPDNVFTYLGGSYAMNVFEPVTQLCPSDLCPRTRESFASRMASLGEDLGIVYLHVLLPEGHTETLPSVTETWQDFGETHEATEAGAKPLAIQDEGDIDHAVGRELWRDQRFQFEGYVQSIQASTEPTFFFLHAMLPHSPWRFLPSGRQYGDSLGIDGIADDRWGTDEVLVTQGLQRHLLQVGFVDRLLGRLVTRLKNEGIYDDALVIVTADHGVSFRPGDRRRGVTPTNIQDIATVPLLVKLPGQDEARTVDRTVRTVDIVPTIADVLDTPLPYEAEGLSLFDPENDGETVSVGQRSGEAVSAEPDDVARGRAERAASTARLFATDLFSVGPNRALLGRPVEAFDLSEAEGLSATVDGEALLRAVDLETALSPSHLTGRLSGERAEAGIDLALAVNGRIAAVTRSFSSAGDVKFSSFAPESAFRQGANDVEVYAVAEGGRALERLGGVGAEASYRLAGGSLEGPDGSIPVVAGALEGAVEDWFFEADTVRFGGWAGDVEERRAAETVLVFAGDELLYSGAPSVGRADLAKRHPGLGRSGFVVELPRGRVGDDGSEAALRFFAVRDGQASELVYAKGFPWKPGD